VCFVFDTTGSMGAYILDAKERAVRLAKEEADRAGLDIRFAIVEYRDHPPQDESFVTRTHRWADFEGFQDDLNVMSADGGGDAPEAVWDGLVAAGLLDWRDNADKRSFLIGDAPPHGYGMPSQWPEGCPCG